ncbi:unnamed protein product [Meganyctiphanes norvegica]|uniref:Uncharacterized protein n=1 Tax=Meganyctiphanes norvegica TaxID=48144 RepID=A0AAV2RXE4_MEGNR
MFILIALVLVGSVHLVICDVDTHVYEYYCEPPAGAILPPSNDTTILPYPILKPIEKCCPACAECEHLAGHCKLRWITHLYPEWCDFKTPYPCRDYSCTCCVIVKLHLIV